MKARLILLCLGGFVFLSHFAAGQPDIDYAEYYFNTDPGPGNGTEFTITDSTSINTTVDIPAETIDALEDGFHKLVVRFRDTDGDYSIGFVRTFKKGADTDPQPTPDIVAAEYYFDTDPGPGAGTAITIPEPVGSSIDLSVEIPADTLNDLEIGHHKLVVRVQDADGDWSVAYLRTIRRVEPPSEESIDPKVARIDYQWLVEGEEVGETVSLTPDEPAKSIEFTHIADLKDLDGVTAVVKMTPWDESGNQGIPGFNTVIIEWLDEENGGQGDGLPDAWEDLYEELDSTVVNDKDKDSDKDNLSDYDEFLAGTDPGNPDTDGDGIWDGSELILTDYGFDPDQDDADLLTNLQAAAFGAGLYSTEFQLKDLNLLAPVVGRDPDTGDIFLRLRIQTSSKLQETDWAQLALGSEDVSTTGGDIKITIPDLEDDIYFLRVFTDQDFE